MNTGKTQTTVISSWMGEVPAHWEVKALKFCADLITQRVNGSEAGGEYIGLEHIESKTGKFARLEGSQESAESMVSCFGVGDVLFGKLRPYLAKVAVAESEGICSSEILVYRPHALNSRYLKHVMLLDSFIEEVNASTYGSKMPRADAIFISRLPVPVPPLEEQAAIANYLDTETKRIDGLIEEKNKLKRLLAELRAKTIFEAVTRGVDTTAPMKDSGVSWIGEIPEHWGVKRVKHIARFTTGWTPPTGDAASYVGSNPWANIGDLGPKVITETAHQISDEAVKNTGIKISPVGSLLFSFKLSVGQVSIAGQPLFTNEAIATFPPQDEFDIQWAYYAFPRFIPENAAVNIYGAKLLNQQRINDALLPFPPRKEQVAIAGYLNSETKRIDDLTSYVDSEIELLKELRASTITDSVLGRIDVGQVAEDQ